MGTIRLRIMLSIGVVAGMLSAAALAQDEPPQVQRYELMEEMREKAEILGDMAKRAAPFDPATADAALQEIVENAEVFPTLFPPGTQTGHDTRALPAIWERRDTFEQQSQDLIDAAKAAMTAADEGFGPFRSAFRDVGRACRACHQDFRAEES
jgi:cytochrome c556